MGRRSEDHSLDIMKVARKPRTVSLRKPRTGLSLNFLRHFDLDVGPPLTSFPSEGGSSILKIKGLEILRRVPTSEFGVGPRVKKRDTFDRGSRSKTIRDVAARKQISNRSGSAHDGDVKGGKESKKEVAIKRELDVSKLENQKTRNSTFIFARRKRTRVLHTRVSEPALSHPLKPSVFTERDQSEMHNAKGITNVALEVGKGSDWKNINRQIFGQSQVDVCSNSLGVSNGLSDKVVINDFSEADPKPGHQTHGLLTQEIGVTKDNSKNGCVHTAREKITPTIPSIQNRSTRKNSRKKPYKEQAIQKITKKAVVKIQAFEPVCSSTGVLKRRIHGNDCNKSDFCHNHQSHKKRKSHDAHNEGYKDAPLRRSSRFLKIGLVEDTQNSDLGLVVKSETCPKHELVGPSVSEKSYALECHHAFHPLTEADSKAASKDLFHGQKQKLPDLEGQLKKLEAAQRHRMKVEMAAREIQAAVIKKILGQGSNREKRFHQGQTQMEQDKARKPLQSNTIRWVMGPTGTIVSFSEESELQRLFVPSTCRYPLPRERCAGLTCTNTYKYRDSKSNIPLCSLQCYQAVNEGIQPVTTC